MKLHANTIGTLKAFTGYGPDHVKVNNQSHQGSLIVTPTSVGVWRPARFDDLLESDFAELLALEPEVVLLGTGERLQFPHPKLTRPLITAQIGVEAMDVAALCRTFNILVAEDRRVVAAVLFG